MLRPGGLVVTTALLLGGCLADVDILQGDSDDDTGVVFAGFGHKNATGFGDTFAAAGSIDTNNAFFASLGSNGRTCVSCHQQAEGWSITPAGVTARFNATSGNDPIFRLNDGAVSPNADVSTVAA